MIEIEKPICYKDKRIFDPKSTLCKFCPWLFPCGTFLGHDFVIEREEFIRGFLEEGHNHLDTDFVSAVSQQYCVSPAAAKLAIRRVKKKLDLERVRKDEYAD